MMPAGAFSAVLACGPCSLLVAFLRVVMKPRTNQAFGRRPRQHRNNDARLEGKGRRARPRRNDALTRCDAWLSCRTMPRNEPPQTTDKASRAPARKRKSRAETTPEAVKPAPTAEERQRIRDRAAASEG